MLSIERALQSELMLRLRAGGWPVLALPLPNGIWIPARTEAERALVARIIARMKADGMLVNGAPDLCIFWGGSDGGSHGALIEIKRPKSRDLLGTRPAGRPSEAQKALAERAAELGIRHAYITSWEELHNQLIEWGVAPPVSDLRRAGVAA